MPTETIAQPTAGPWTFKIRSQTNECCGKVMSATAYVSADTGHKEIAVLYSQDNQESNARLIAAAPDLLAALKDMTAIFERAAQLSGCGREFIEIRTAEARAAIAKAEGR